MGALRGVALGLVASAAVVGLVGAFARSSGRPAPQLVAEDASAPLERIAIHYAPSSDAVALTVWKQLFTAMPPTVEVEVEVAKAEDFTRFASRLRAWNIASPERFHAVIVGKPITTWSRDRYAATVDADGQGGILAPPVVETPFAARAGDMQSPFAISRALYGREPRTADFVFEGGDLAATPHFIFADVNLPARNLGRSDTADRASFERELHRDFAQTIVWLGDVVGDVPRHHMMMYAVPLDDHTVAVGDVRAGVTLLATEVAGAELALDDVERQAPRFDRAAAELTAKGFHVVRVPALVLAGGGSFVTYTNAVFDVRADGKRVVYLPTYALPALDAAATRFYTDLGYDVRPIDVSRIYLLNGSLGCLVNVLARIRT